MPLTLHAAWLRFDAPFPDGQLFLWAENVDRIDNDGGPPNSGNGADASIHTANGRHRSARIPSHPFQASAGQVRALLANLAPGLDGGSVQPANATVWLPTIQGTPVARRGVLHQATHLRQTGASSENVSLPPLRPELANWQVTGVTLPALDVLTSLNHLDAPRGVNRPRGWRHYRLGNDLIYWSNAAKIALEILVSQHYLPALRASSNGRFYATWQPALLDQPLRQRLTQLVTLMPPVCRAYELNALGDALHPAALTEHFLAALVDNAVREWAEDPAPPSAISPALHWIERLRGPQRQLVLPPQPVHQLYQEWRSWIEQLQASSDANFRICFKLSEPAAPNMTVQGDVTEAGDEETDAEDGAVWSLRYFLQARDNPQLRIPASQIWQLRNGALHIGDRRLDQPQERLLAGLGVASRLFPPIQRSLRSPQPEQALLNTDEAHQFLSEIGPLLAASGFGVVMPEWWRTEHWQRLGLKLRLFADDQTEEEFGEDEEIDWTRDGIEFPNTTAENAFPPQDGVHYEWALTLGGEPLSRQEFERLTAKRTPLVRLRDHWVELDPRQVEAAEAFLAKRRPQGAMSFLQALRMAQSFSTSDLPPEEQIDDGVSKITAAALMAQALTAGAAMPPEELPAQIPLEAVEVEGWLEHALEQLRNQSPAGELSEPVGFKGELRPYQRRGVGWLLYLRNLGLGACLADDMGLGKTVQALALLLHVRDRARHQDTTKTPPPTLLICPTSVVANWKHETDRFAPSLRVLVHHGAGRQNGEKFLESVRNHELIVTSYGTARRDIELLTQIRWGELILDEAQNIKNPRAKQTQAVRRLEARNRIALTGTPVENRLSELWSIMEFLNSGYLDGSEQFRKRFIVPIERYNDDGRAAELRRLVQPFLLRRLKSDPTIISDLPEKNEMVVYCTLTNEQTVLYETTVRTALATLDQSSGIQRRGLVLGLLTKLKQISNHPAHYLKEEGPLPKRSGKLDRLTEMLEEALSVGDQALVFTQFVEMGHLLQRHLHETLGAEVLFLHGGTPAKQRDRMVQEFQDKDGPPIFVLSLRAGGSGLNLTRANHVFHYDRWWNPAVENQATDRAFRIGQTRNVQVHKFVVAGTLEERINEMIESKQALAEAIVGSGEEWLTELNNDELRELLMLRREAL
jgi:SNF2 family DNA or RNA helicase